MKIGIVLYPDFWGKWDCSNQNLVKRLSRKGHEIHVITYSEPVRLWKETVAPNTKTSFNNTTMPHILIRTADGNFRFTQVDGSSYTIQE